MKNLTNYIYKKRLKNLIYIIISFLFIKICYDLFFDEGFLLGILKIGDLFSRMYPFDFYIIPSIINSLFETIMLALLSSFLGVITTILLLPFLSNILFSIKILPKLISGVFSILRTIPTLIFAAILVSIFSVGSFSGFMSLYIIALLMSAKILKEYSEEIPIKYIESCSSHGFTRLKIYRVAVLENLKNNIYSVFFLVLESNIRGASVLGLVGAGGIGQLLWKELNHFRYDRVSLIILFLVACILFIDMLSLYFRTNDKDSELSGKKYFFRKLIFNILFFGMFITSIIYAYNYLNISSDRIVIGFRNLKNMFNGILNPDFAYSEKTLLAIYESLLVAFYSTILAGITTILLSPLVASNISGKIVSLFTKVVINILRTFPPIIVAIIFFRGFGPGYISSFFALYIYTFGIMTKMYSEVLEGIDKNLINSLDSVGLSKVIMYFKIIFKGYLPEFLSILLFRFEMNIKNSTILGMVGVGGIGQLLINNIEFRNWQRISLILLYLCLVIIFIENISAYIREKIKK